MEGIIVVDKPKGWTSFDAVKKVRGLTRVKKVGHSGTLDPMATGVLPLFLGSATKSVSFFMNGRKGYEGEITFGIKTTTLDADGEVVERKTPQIAITREILADLFKRFTGQIEQIPPMVSAIHHKGKRLYELAREGREVKREPRTVTVHELKLIDLTDGEFPKAKFYCSCSKGTYIRSLVSDIADLLGCGGHLSALKRVYSHPFAINQAYSIDEIQEMVSSNKLNDELINPKALIMQGGRLD